MDRLYRIRRKWWTVTPLVALLLAVWLIAPGGRHSNEIALSDAHAYPPRLLAAKASFQTVALSLEPADGDAGLAANTAELQRIPVVETTPDDDTARLHRTPHLEPEGPDLSSADEFVDDTPAEFQPTPLAELRRTPAVEQSLASALDTSPPDVSAQDTADNSAFLDLAPPIGESRPTDVSSLREHRHEQGDEQGDEQGHDDVGVASMANGESLANSPENETLAVPPSIPLEAVGLSEADQEQSVRQPLPSFGMSDQQLAALSRSADLIVEAGLRLAARGATYSARTEFVMALRMIAQGLDAQAGGKQHSEALSAAFRAMRESEGFTPQGVNMEADIDMAVLIAAHRTPVLQSVDAEKITPMLAIQSYYTYAQEQFAIAGGRVGAASHALFSLGKLQQSKHGAAQGRKLQAARAMAFHQSALLVDARNYLAANELGVLLAQYGQWDDARRMLLHSIAVTPIPETWHNLSVVHQRLGQTDLAQRAQYEAGQMRLSRSTGAAPSDPNAPIRWLSPEKFAQTNPRPNGAPLPRPQTDRRGPTSQPPKNAARPAKSKKWGWW